MPAELLMIGAFVVIVLFALARQGRHADTRRTPAPGRRARPSNATTSKPTHRTATNATRTIRGPAYVIDGDSIVIRKTEIRIFGVDAPEFNHPYGRKAKWALLALCKGQTVTAEILQQDAHGRTVARCTLPDGRDLSAEMVKIGLAIDWPKYSGGIYRALEPDGIRKELWLADARQKGRMHVWAQFEARQNSARHR